jgi:hypothetical protein
MKRQLGAMLVVGVLLCATLAWSQSGDSGSSQTGSSSSSPSGSSSSSSSGSSGSFSPGGSSSSPYLFTNSSPDPQNGSGDPTQTDTGSDNSQAGTTGPQDTFAHPEQLPALSVFSDQVSHTGYVLNTYAGSIAQYTNTTGAPSYWDTLTNVGAGISIAQYKASYSWVLNYQGGLDFSSGYAVNETQLSQTAFGGVTWNFAKRWQLKLKDSYFYSDNPFTPFLTYLGNPTPNNPNPVFYYPEAVVEQNQAHADLVYSLTPHDAIELSGSENFQRYIRGGGSALWNSVSYSGGAFYQHTYSAQLAFGGGYNFSSLDFGHGESRAGVQTFEGFISYVFNPKVNFSLWIGPELTATKDIVPVFCDQYGCFVETQHAQSWSIAEGGTFKWKISPGNEFAVQGSRGVSNAGGILGAANIYQVVATYGRPINRVWSFGAGFGYSSSNSVSEFRADQYVNSLAGTVGFNRRLFSDAWTLNAYYAFVHQNENYFGLPATSSTSGVGFTIRYVWEHGLGR